MSDICEVNISHHLTPKVHIVASLIDKSGEPFHITGVGKQIPAFLQNRWFVWICATGLSANTLFVIIMCPNLTKGNEKHYGRNQE
jgi:hypothetical protein